MTYTDLEGLNDDELLKLDADLTYAIKKFREAMLPATEEMTWLMKALPLEIKKRNLEPKNNDNNDG